MLLLGGIGAILGNLLWVMRGVYYCQRQRELLEINAAQRQVILWDMKRGLFTGCNPYQDHSQN
jgi:hypothetical protein